MRLLLVDDDVQARQSLVKLARAACLEVIGEAANGREALAAAVANHPDLIITDCQMPLMDGISLTRALRGLGDLTPVIMLSGHCDPAAIRLALEAGVTRYVPKPLDPNVLMMAIAETAARYGIAA